MPVVSFFTKSQGATGGISLVRTTKLGVVAPHNINIPIHSSNGQSIAPAEVYKRQDGVTQTQVPYEFTNDNADDFVTNEFIEFDGTMHLKTTYEITPISMGTLSVEIDSVPTEGVIFESIISLSGFEVVSEVR